MKAAVGPRLPTSTATSAVAVAPSLSVTWTRTVFDPPRPAKVCAIVEEADATVSNVPSPSRSQRYEATVPSPSVEPEASNVTETPDSGAGSLAVDGRGRRLVGDRPPSAVVVGRGRRRRSRAA